MNKVVDKSMLGNAWVLAQSDFDKNDDLDKYILASRGICNDADVQKFLNPSIKEYMPDPFVLSDMESGA